MTRTTLVLSGLGALVVCLAVGYAWGASGRRTAEIALDQAQQQWTSPKGAARSSRAASVCTT